MECHLCFLSPCECGQIITARMQKKILKDDALMRRYVVSRAQWALYREGKLAKNLIKPFVMPPVAAEVETV